MHRNTQQRAFFGPHIKRLHGELEGKHRYEVGGMRIVYEVNAGDKIVEVRAMRSRGDIYKKYSR